MKNLFRLLGIIAFVAVIGFGMAACGGGGGGGGSKHSGNPVDPNQPGTNQPGTTASIKFNLTGAKAIVASEGSSGSGRAAWVDGNNLLKILEDNTMVPIFDGLQDMPNVKFIARSPVDGKKDLYIYFGQDWYSSGESKDEWGNVWWDYVKVCGKFIHVKEDGTIVNIIEDGTGNTWGYINSNDNEYPITFDRNGNLYYIVQESSSSSYTNVIYKYNPSSGTKQQLTAAVNNTWYSKVGLSSDGAYMIANGSRWSNINSVSFSRLIPTANPDQAEYIYYNSGSYSSDIYSFVFHRQKREVYITGTLYTEGSDIAQQGLLKLSIGGPSRNDWQLATMFSNSNNYVYFFNYFYDNNTYTSTCGWREEYKNAQGDPDYTKIMEVLYQYFGSDYIEFRYNGRTNEEALASLTSSNIYDIYYYNGGQEQFFRDNVYHTATNSKLTYSNIQIYSIQLFLASDNSIWGMIGYYENNRWKAIFSRLLNREEKRDFYTPTGMSEKIIVSTKPMASHLYFCADTTTGSIETGYHNIYRFSYDNPDTIENLFDGIGRNIEVVSYDIGGDDLYFSGVQGTNLITGKISLSNHQYTEMQFGQKITALVSYY